MSEKQWRRLDAVERVVEGNWTMAQGAGVAGLSVRQFRRLRRAYEKAEVKSDCVVHGNSGRAPVNRLCKSATEQVLKLRRGRYKGLNDTHFTEKLVEKHGFKISRQSVQRILRGAKVASPQGRKAKKRRRRRERRAKAGWMILWDGSTHDWLEGRGPPMCLMGAIDDATGKILRGAHFVAQECSASYLKLLQEMVRHHGIPLEIYGDKHSCLRRNDNHWTVEEQLAGRQEPPQVQRALESLGIELIWANSPQAKGRIERAWKTFQDRLISELRLADVDTLEEANKVLEAYRRVHNSRFARRPKDRSSAWRTPAKGMGVAEICSFHTSAVVRKDSSISYGGKYIDLSPPGTDCIAGKQVDIRHLLTGQLRLYIDGSRVKTIHTEAPLKAPKRRKKTTPSAAKAKGRKKMTFKQIKAKHKKAA